MSIQKTESASKQRVVAEPGSIEELRQIHQIELSLTLAYLATLVTSLTQMLEQRTPVNETAGLLSALGTVVATALTVRKKRQELLHQAGVTTSAPATTGQMPGSPNWNTQSFEKPLHQ